MHPSFSFESILKILTWNRQVQKRNKHPVPKAGAKRERELPRVEKSFNSRSHLALNSHALSTTLGDSHTLSSNLIFVESRREPVFSRLVRVGLVTR